METVTIKVDGMSCEHCVKAVKDAVSALPGITEVVVELAAGTATVDYDPAQVTVGQMKTEIEDQGYDIG